MSTPAPMKLESVIARAMAELRLERGWTQADLAWRMTAMGLAWSPNRVSQLESLRRPVSLFEVAALSWVFSVPISRLLAGDEDQDIETPDGKLVFPLAHIRAMLTGDITVHRGPVEEIAGRQKTYVEEIRRVAKNLEIEPQALEWLSLQLYGRTFVEEREVRLGDVSDLSKHSARTKRGHTTRGLTAELREHLDREGRDQVMNAYLKDQSRA